MKNFKEYLLESKKVYAFKIKVAGELPENFKEDLKTRLTRCSIKTFEETGRTPIQSLPLDFPEMTNAEVTMFDVVFEYPVTSPEIEKELTEMQLNPASFRVRGLGEPTEVEQVQSLEEPSGKALLADSNYSEAAKIKHKDFFGDEFNRGFLKDLEKLSKERKKELGQGKNKPDVLGTAPKSKQDKAGAKSAMGS
jgi:hypothetical protein